MFSVLLSRDREGQGTLHRCDKSVHVRIEFGREGILSSEVPALALVPARMRRAIYYSLFDGEMAFRHGEIS